MSEIFQTYLCGSFSNNGWKITVLTQKMLLDGIYAVCFWKGAGVTIQGKIEGFL
jgi:hypothetical protein